MSALFDLARKLSPLGPCESEGPLLIARSMIDTDPGVRQGRAALKAKRPRLREAVA
jgi:hypothetical protein